MTDSISPQQPLADMAELARILGHHHRLILLEHIARGEQPVERLVEASGLSVANTSQHLQQLRRGGFVQTRRDGKRVLYSLSQGPLAALLGGLRQYVDYNHGQIRELLADSEQQPGRLEGISREELRQRLQEGGMTLLDVRSPQEFALGHLPGAINIPVEELEQRLAELPAGQELVAYCRGPYCVLSHNAAALLRAKGFRVRRLDDGFVDWQAAGLGVETTR
ncbi:MULTISPECIES: ArsR/SmtB family transcription factor [Pseudomonas]|jgi:rhodanese-related sulfurtransferase/DNA-binding transcriptional ArsR family regulator|uniref:Transcriptional regulator, ArsR family/rhodanese-like domain protein n=1 Tax=Pseudomonas protegens (strain DSM 19095 / LMG 27888 / CFBP 6595 / CHA0) TaxID=1124983 RepID=A0A2C9ESU2_PSEPH|nr:MULTISPECIES: metalloregulator ArsR/SmtB family transcription factor [Pseudomonas]BCQ64583.1 ArsR family transcriptional regulator [Pseudomonas sp. Boi14]GED75253.1 ArsR family transcriptional regulator [Pseudomonas fluorescens]AGL86730.1 transcriptional regulator, ArsR family/rhodanese-like domain protein [Pseudomonas protegens CHA0]AQT11844.1 ArsR family transcriptional regulator [Pseudomonas protegens]MBF0638183.1 metalloregulator ArsR/SmtB family transcription factor [Pseudomonas proteg